MNTRSGHAIALRPTLVYLLLGVVWILASDRLLDRLVQDQAMLTTLQTLKGWAWVTLSAVVIYSLVRREVAGLNRAERRFQSLVEHSLAGVCVVQHGRLAYVNPTFAEIFGASVDELLAVRDVRDLVVTEDRERFGDILHPQDGAPPGGTGRAAPGNEVVKVLRRCDEAPSSVEVTAQPMEWRGEPGVLAMVLDRSEQERLEEQLRHAQKMDAMGRLTGSIAHDFNNLLTAAGIPIELAIGELGPGHPARADLGDARRAIESATRLSQQLLTFSRRRVIHPRPVDLAGAVRELSGMLARLLGRGVELVVETGELPGTVLIDPSHLEQVIVNLVVNARDAMPGGGTVTIRTSLATADPEVLRHRGGLEPGPHGILEVIDTGSGIDEGVRRHIFEPFFTTKEKGTGLGLSTVFGIVRQAGGFVRVRSEPGAGTAMRVYLPLDTSVHAGDNARRAPCQGKAPAPEGERTILVVEDDDAVRRVLDRVLTGAGYHVLNVGDAREALALAREHEREIHLMITDVTLPGMSGVALGTEFRKYRPRTAVLYSSGYSEEDIPKDPNGDRTLPFLEKPFQARELLNRVGMMLAEGPREWA